MKKRILILIAVAVSGLAFVLGRTSARASLDEGAQGQVPVNCAIPKTNGTLRGFSFSGGGTLLLFEDSTGMIRLINDSCRVHSKFSRE